MTPGIPVETSSRPAPGACPACEAARAPATGRAWRRRFCSAECRRRAEFEVRRLRRRLHREETHAEVLRPCTRQSLYRELRTFDGKTIHDLLRPFEQAARALRGRLQALGEDRRARDAQSGGGR